MTHKLYRTPPPTCDVPHDPEVSAILAAAKTVRRPPAKRKRVVVVTKPESIHEQWESAKPADAPGVWKEPVREDDGK